VPTIDERHGSARLGGGGRRGGDDPSRIGIVQVVLVAGSARRLRIGLRYAIASVPLVARNRLTGFKAGAGFSGVQ
jgi:hypothetical protein